MVSLESNKVFRGLTPAELDRLRAAAEVRTYAAGDAIFRQGDKGDGVYFLREGVVALSILVANGDSKVLTRLPEGEMFGEMAIIDSESRSATAIADKPTIVDFISHAEMSKVLETTPHVYALLAREISRRQRAFNDQYIREVFESERLALVGRFASSIVHDLKNPLNIIGISADMACMPSATADSRHLANVRIRKQVERISNMVNELLEFTQGAHTNFVLAQVSYKNFVEQLIEEIQQEVSIKSVRIEYINPAPAVPVRINPQRLSRVFHNLIGNAADAMAVNGGGTIRVRFAQNDSEVTTELEDSGKGIAPQMLDKLFQAFATYGKANGTGLGLSICKKIVQDHRGKIYARNVPGGGALFGFTLPVPKQAQAPA